MPLSTDAVTDVAAAVACTDGATRAAATGVNISVGALVTFNSAVRAGVVGIEEVGAIHMLEMGSFDVEMGSFDVEITMLLN